MSTAAVVDPRTWAAAKPPGIRGFVPILRIEALVDVGSARGPEPVGVR